MKFDFKKNISFKINILMIFIIIVLFLVIGIFEFRTSQRENTDRLRSDYEIISNRLIETLKNPIWDLDINIINNILIAEMQNENIYSIVVIDYQTSKFLAGKTRGVSWEIVGLNNLPDSPFEKKVEVSIDGDSIALIELQLSNRFYKAEIDSKIKELVVQTIMLIIVFSFVLSFTISFIVIKPVEKLAKAVESIAQGNLNMELDSELQESKDEIGLLAGSFDQMRIDLAKSRASLEKYSKNLEKEVKARTAELEKERSTAVKGEKKMADMRTATLSILKDVKETKKELEKANDRLKELDRLKSQFLSTTSHELRTPMTPMKIQMELLLEDHFGKLNKKQRKSLDMVLRNTEHLDKLIADILDISRIQAERLKFEMEKGQVADCIKETVENMKQFADKQNIVIATEIAKLPKIRLDKGRITQVLNNLIDNAIKFTPQKGKIIVEAEEQNNNILVKVKDTGVGIPEKDLKNIFEPFFQVDSSYKRKYEGTGLGLAICKGIIKQHGGKIWVESIVGKGTTFYFNLPLKAVKFEEKQKGGELK